MPERQRTRKGSINFRIADDSPGSSTNQFGWLEEVIESEETLVAEKAISGKNGGIKINNPDFLTILAKEETSAIGAEGS